LYGFSSADPTRFKRTTAGSTSTGQQELFFVEDEELDFETILSAPLPKVPLDVTYTGMSRTAPIISLDHFVELAFSQSSPTII